MAEERSDAELVEAYRRTAAPADFGTLVQRHRISVLRFVLGVLGPDLQADAEDVVQLAFLRAHDRLGSFRGDSRFSTWLHRIARNIAIDHARTQRRRRRLLDADAQRSDAAQVAHGTLDEDVQRTRALQAALLEVPEPHQTALRLHYWLDLPVADIAKELGVRVGTVKSYLHRGRARLHRILTMKELLE